MRNIYSASKQPDALTKGECEAIVQLHQQAFDMPAEDIIGYLKERTYVDLLYEKKRGKLVGTVGIQWFISADIVIVYVGNAVIDKNVQSKGLLTYLILRAVCKASLKYPFKRKLLLGFATSPKAYAYFTKYKYSWPKPFEVMPQDIYEVIGKYLSNHCEGHFSTHEHGYIIIPREVSVKAKNKNQALKRFQESWFSCSNIAYEEGYQLPCIAAINIRNYLTLFGSMFKLTKKSRKLARFKQYIFRFRDTLYLFAITTLILLLFSD